MSDENTNTTEVETDSNTPGDVDSESTSTGKPRMVLILAGFAGFGILLATGLLIGVEAYTVDWDGEVELVSDGETVETFSVVYAENKSEKESGLGGVETLESGTGMLFVHDAERTYTYVMPRMEFGIDILFIDESCTIQSVHEAKAPSANETGLEPHHRYTGVGKYVLEVPRGEASDTIAPGDTVQVNGGCGV